jgi:hypothetical protein
MTEKGQWRDISLSRLRTRDTYDVIPQIFFFSLTVSKNYTKETVMKWFNSQWEPTDSVSGFFFRRIRDVHTRLCAILRIVQQLQYHHTTTMRGCHGNYVPQQKLWRNDRDKHYTDSNMSQSRARIEGSIHRGG